MGTVERPRVGSRPRSRLTVVKEQADAPASPRLLPGQPFPRRRDGQVGDWVLCRIFFHGEKTVKTCNKLLDELAERGYIHIARSDPEKSIKYHVAKRLRELGILMHTTAASCTKNSFHRIYVTDRKRMAKLRLEFDQIDRPWPPCI